MLAVLYDAKRKLQIQPSERSALNAIRQMSGGGALPSTRKGLLRELSMDPKLWQGFVQAASLVERKAGETLFQAGDPGVATLYAAPDAGPALVAAFEDSPYGTMYLPSVTGFDPLSMLATSVFPLSFSAADYGSGGDYAVASRPSRVERRDMRQLEKEIQRLEEMTPAEQEKYFQKQEGVFLEYGQGKAGAVPGPAPGQEPVAVGEQPIDIMDEEEFSQPALPPEQPITKADIEAKLTELKRGVDGEVANVRGIAIGVGITVVVVLVVATFLLGRRRGRKLATIVEIRRV